MILNRFQEISSILLQLVWTNTPSLDKSWKQAQKLSKEGIQLGSVTNHFKFEAPDGKRRSELDVTICDFQIWSRLINSHRVRLLQVLVFLFRLYKTYRFTRPVFNRFSLKFG